MLEHAREVGGRNLRKLTFHERAAAAPRRWPGFLPSNKDDFYTLSYATGATKGDSWIDIDGASARCSCMRARARVSARQPRCTGCRPWKHCRRRDFRGAAHLRAARRRRGAINAFNFPVWGMLEKLAPTLLAGVPAISSSRPHRPVTSPNGCSGGSWSPAILPEGAVQLILRRRGGSV